jgi:two-component system sensor histidine kinase MprB
VSLRRRITAATALAVAAVAIAMGVVSYLSTRSHLRGGIDRQLQQRAASFLGPHNNGGGGPDTFGRLQRGVFPGQFLRGPGGPGLGGGPFVAGDGGPAVPPTPAFGGAGGYFEFVYPDGEVGAGGGGTPELPVTTRMRSVAAGGRGYFTDATVRGTHLRQYVAYDTYDHYAVVVALPLTEVDRVLRELLPTYGALIGAGVLLAIIVGGLLGRWALAPVERFTRRTERVTGALDGSQRLEEAGASELVRLAGSFNRTLDALERSVQAQRALVADASHELRTPIAALRSNIQIFLEAERLPAEERVALQHAIIAELDDLTQLVADVLELARGSVMRGERREPVELDGVVREAVARTQRRAPELSFELELEPTIVVGAPERLGRAVLNVVDNARKYSPPDGRVEITLQDGTLTVRDHGPGFEERDLPHVFDRFYRAEQARRLPGSGLGLAIVKQAAEAHGGGVQARNAPGGGAAIVLRFGPAERPPAPPETAMLGAPAGEP